MIGKKYYESRTLPNRFQKIVLLIVELELNYPYSRIWKVEKVVNTQLPVNHAFRFHP